MLRMSMLQESPHGWHGAPSGGFFGFFVKKTIRVEVPVDKYPNVRKSAFLRLSKLIPILFDKFM